MKTRKLSKIILAITCLVAVVNSSNAQPGTLEMTSLCSNTTLLGPSTAPVSVTLREDIANLTVGTHFRAYSSPLTITTSFANQQYNTVYSNMSTGMAFGGGTTGSTGGTTQQALPNLVYNALGATLVQKPQNGMFVSSPSGTIVPNYQLGGRGVGLDPQATQFGSDDDNFGAFDYSFGMAVYNTVEPLFDANLPKDGRYYYGDIIIKFSRPVTNPVVHIGGLGGSYSYQPIGAGPRLISYFSTELELQNAGVTSTFMAGNENLNIVGNNILNSAARPNGGSYDDGGTEGSFPTYGAATGSVRVNGTVTELVYKVYVRGSVNSDFNFSKNMADITGATRDPFNGDLFYIAVSMDKPVLQIISGNIFHDADGLADNNIAESGSVVNPKTNAGGGIFANLINNVTNLVVASMPIPVSGSYIFSGVPPGTYRVQLTTNSSPGTYIIPATIPATALPAGWVNTGEFNGIGIGSDGTVNGQTAPITVNLGDTKTDNNFGIERLPDSKPFTTQIQSPLLNTVITLNSPLLPILTGSDPEDKPVEGVLTTKTVQITSLPANSTLRYNGNPVTVNQVISNFNPANLTIIFNIMTTVQHSDFLYAYVDAAGKPDPTPALYRVFWSGGPLIITLSEFTATKNNCTANLNWKTSSEINGDRFEVEVSTNNNAVYSTVGTVIAVGNSSTPKSYQYSYAMQPGVTYFFRLKMVDKDGSFKYSDIRSLNCSTVKGIVIAPNPVITKFTITGMENGKNSVTVYAANGQLVKTQVIAQSQGEVDIFNLAPGFYTVKVTSETGNSVINKIVKY